MSRAPIGVLALLVMAGLAACTTGTHAGSPAVPGTTRTITASSPTPTTAVAAPPAVPPSVAPTPLPPLPTPASGSGIAGLTTVNRCPQVRAESPCPAQPVSARMSIVDSVTGNVVAAVASRSDGRFTVAVKPGRYVIRVVSLAGGPPHPQAPVLVTVTAGHYTTLTLRFDSGIR